MMVGDLVCYLSHFEKLHCHVMVMRLVDQENKVGTVFFDVSEAFDSF